jgi:hypothetical protein
LWRWCLSPEGRARAAGYRSTALSTPLTEALVGAIMTGGESPPVGVG